MSKITLKSAQAFANNVESAIDNTTVSREGMFLFGNHIAKREGYGVIAINFCGYPTRTTSDRINGILSELTNGKIKVGIKNGRPELRYRTGEKVTIADDEWVYIDTLSMTQSENKALTEMVWL